MTDREDLARACDPAAFEFHEAEARRPFAAVQWAARRHQALEVADRLLASDWLNAHDRQVIATHSQTIMDAQRDAIVEALADAEARGYARKLSDSGSEALEAVKREAKADALVEGGRIALGTGGFQVQVAVDMRTDIALALRARAAEYRNTPEGSES